MFIGRILFYAVIFMLTGAGSLMAKEVQTINLTFVTQAVELPPALSNLIEEPEDLGLHGARLALKDNNTTGKFMGQKFTMDEITLQEEDNVSQAVNDAIGQGASLFILDLPDAALSDVLKNVSHENMIFFNARSRSNKFRQDACDPRMLHTIPSRAMLTDALAQFMIKKRWNKWFILSGQVNEDNLFKLSLERSAQKFGAKIITNKTWDGARDARRTAQSEVPLLTQSEDYHVLMVADERGDFGEYLMYRTFDPRPVAGTQGLFPTGWYWTQEQWGAVQLQNRFKRLANRFMEERDYAAWAAVRSVGEAATRTKSGDFSVLHDYIVSEDFELGAFKGRKLSYRNWNGQLRQPIALSAARSLVAQAPLEGFLHRSSELDTLGFDKPESKCKAFIK